MREREEMYKTCDNVEQTEQYARHFLQMLRSPSLPSRLACQNINNFSHTYRFPPTTKELKNKKIFFFTVGLLLRRGVDDLPAAVAAGEVGPLHPDLEKRHSKFKNKKIRTA